jgi:hypothetical protein
LVTFVSQVWVGKKPAARRPYLAELASAELALAELPVRRAPQTFEAIMDELLAGIAANVGVERSVAEKAVGIILDFLLKEGPSDKVQVLVDGLPGADALIQTARADAGGSGVFAGMGGIMGVGSRLMSAGLGMDQIRKVTHEVITCGREKVGSPAVDEVVAGVPGLSAFI